MKNNKFLLSHAVKAGIFSLTLFSAAHIHAESPPVEPAIQEITFPPSHDLYARADTDDDGMISAEEYYKLHTATTLMQFEMTFNVIDTNGDRLVHPEEFTRFLPTVDAAMAKQQYVTAAGDDRILDSEEFSVMRLKEQGGSNNAMWAFALLDRDHDGQLAPYELYDSPHSIIQLPEVTIDPAPVVEPPELLIEPPELVIEPPELIIDTAPVKPPELIVEPPELIIDTAPVKPPELIVEPPELLIDTALAKLPTHIRPIDRNVFVGPPNPAAMAITQAIVDQVIAIDENAIKSLKEKLARLRNKLSRLEKSVAMTTQRLENETSDAKLARLERRLKRQNARLATLENLYQMALTELANAE